VPQSASAQPSLAALARLADNSTPARAFDDDPLTSPSFPAVGTADSRSYRSRRSRSADRAANGSHAAEAPAPPPAYQATPQPSDASYGSQPAAASWQASYNGAGYDAFGRESAGYDNAGAGAQQIGYQSQSAGMPTAAQPPVAASYQIHPSLPLPTGPQSVPPTLSQPLSQPAANPYGSYVSDAPVSYQQQPAEAPAYQGGSHQYEQPMPQNGYLPAGDQQGNGQYYHGDANGYVANGYAADGYAANGYASSEYATNGYAANGYATNGYAANGYQVGAEQAAYAQPGYQSAPLGQSGYNQQDPAYGLDGATGYPGYGQGGR
jgi:hypothetical protein